MCVLDRKKFMQVTVHYLAQLRRAAGCSTEIAALPDAASLCDLLRALGDRRGGAFRALVLDDAQAPRTSLLFFVGDEHADPTRILRDGDSVSILTPMAGGCT
jgi:molybdopterin converting factor small subunit